MEVLQVQVLSLWHEEPWDWRAMGEVAGVSFQCFIGGDACPMCLHHEARAHPGYCQRWPTAWGALQHSRRRVHSIHVQCAGYHCAESCACVWVWAVTAFFCGRTQGVAGIIAVAPRSIYVVGTGISRGLQASLRQRPGVARVAELCQAAGGELCGTSRGRKKTKQHSIAGGAFTAG